MIQGQDSLWRPQRLAVVGVGLLGGSVALSAKRCWPDLVVCGSSRKQETCQKLLDLRTVDEAYQDFRQCVAGCDLVVVAAPVGSIAAALPEIASSCDPNATITDVGSTKSSIVAAAEADADAALRFVGSHPIAGSEKTGVEHAVDDLFVGKRTIITPTNRTDGSRHQKVENFWRQLGSDVLNMSPAEHDRALAAASHMPHIVSAALAQALPEEFRQLTGTGFRDATRIAAGDPVMWRQITEANSKEIAEEIDRFCLTLKHFQDAIKRSDWPQLEQLFLEAMQAKHAIDDIC